MNNENFFDNADSWKNCTNHEDVCITTNNSLLLATSSLTHRFWKGKLSLYDKTSLNQDFYKNCPSSNAFCENCITNVKPLPSVNRFITSHDSGDVSMWQLPEVDGSEIIEVVSNSGHDDSVLSLDINCDQSRFSTGSIDCQLRIWDTKECDSIAAYTGHSEMLTCTSFHPKNPDVLTTCSYDKKVLFWDLRNIKPVFQSYTFNTLVPKLLAYVPNNPNLLFIGTERGELLVIDTRNLKEMLSRTTLHASNIHRLAFNPSKPQFFATCSDDLTVAVSEIKGNHIIESHQKYMEHCDMVRGLAWLESKILVSCSWDGTVRLQDVNLSPSFHANGSGDN